MAIVFNTKHKLLIGSLLLLFIAAVSLKLHRYSLPLWSEILESGESGTILGNPRWIRSDDWGVELPLMLSQLHHAPRFPVFNRHIGQGNHMLTHSKAPVCHWLMIFRPGTWGFFLGANTGVAWMWWFMELGLFYAMFLFFMMITRNAFYLSILASLLVVFSFFFQAWSLHKAEILIFTGAIFVSFFELLSAERTRKILLKSMLLGWALGCFGLHFIYPAFQVVCAFFLLFAMIGFLIKARFEIAILSNWQYKAAGVAGAILMLAVALGTFYYSAQDVIIAMLESEYPGKRFSLGGDYPVWMLFSTNFFLPLINNKLDQISWHLLGNQCEAASFINLCPPLMAAFIIVGIGRKRIPDAFAVSILLYIFAVSVFICVGIPSELSRISLLYLVPGNRAVLGFGIAATVLVVYFIAHKASVEITSRVFLSAGFAAVMILCGLKLSSIIEPISIQFVVAVSIGSGVVAYFIMDGYNGERAMTILVLISISSTIWLNPLVRGGVEDIQQSSISKKMIEIDRACGGNTVWSSSGPWYYANLFRILGLKSVGGTYTHPHLQYWSHFDESGKYKREYNRFAHMVFEPANVRNITFFSPWPDLCQVQYNPYSSVLSMMGITHMLVVGKGNILFERNEFYRRIYSHGDKSIYSILR